MKLFACVLGQTGGVAVFGKKDYQQLMVIRQMVQQFALPITIVAGDTARAPDGLALSSRNGYLSLQERQEAVALSQALRHLSERWLQALQQSDLTAPPHALEAQAMDVLRARGWQPDYLTVRRRTDLQPATAHTAHAALHQGHASKIGQGINGLPGRLVAHAHIACSLRDGAALRNAAQDGNAAVGHVIAQRLRDGVG